MSALLDALLDTLLDTLLDALLDARFRCSFRYIQGRDFSTYKLLIFCLEKTRLAEWHLKPARSVAPPSHWMIAVIFISALSPKIGATSIALDPIQEYRDLIRIFRTKLLIVEERQGDLYIRGGIEQIKTLSRENLALLPKDLITLKMIFHTLHTFESFPFSRISSISGFL